MKKRKFALGGEIDGNSPIYPEPTPIYPEPMPNPTPNQGGTAREGLSSINQGASTVGSALDQVSGSLRGAAESIGGGPGFGVGGGKGPTDSPSPMPDYWKKMATMKKGGKVKSYAKGGTVSSASSRADGIAQRGKTKGRMC